MEDSGPRREAVRRQVRTAARIAAAVGVVQIAAALLVLSDVVTGTMPKASGGVGLPGLFFSHFQFLVGLQGVAAAILLGSGIELAQFKESGRRRMRAGIWLEGALIVAVGVLMVTGSLSMPRLARSAVDPIEHAIAVGFAIMRVFLPIFATALTAGLLLLARGALRWLGRPEVREVIASADSRD